MLNETAPPVIGQPVLDELARHLKLSQTPQAGTNSEAECALRAAIAHLEAQLGLALIEREFIWQGAAPYSLTKHAPMAPVSEIVSVAHLGPSGESTALEAAFVTLDKRDVRSKLTFRSALPMPIVLTFVAGFGPDWSDTPPDLRQACFMLTAHYFDTRHDVGEAGVAVPHGVAALIAAWRPVRLSVGAPL